MKQKGLLSTYFNKRTKGPALWTGVGAGLAAVNFASGGTLGLAFGAAMLGVTASNANKWKIAATGKGWWTPKNGMF